MMDRLLREGNPPAGQLASPVPQAWNPAINDFQQVTGQDLGGGRFGADGVQWGKTASGLFVPVRVTNDGVQEVQVSGPIIVNPASSKGWISALATVSKTEKVKGRGASIFVWSDTAIPVKVRGISSIAETHADPLPLGTIAKTNRVHQFKIPVEVLPADNLELIFENPVDWSIRYQYQLVWEV